jgi:hypothetical protein
VLEPAKRGSRPDPARHPVIHPDELRRAASGAKARPATASPQKESEAPAPLFGEGVGEDPQSGSAEPRRKGVTGARTDEEPETSASGIDAVVRSAARTPGTPDGGGIGTGLLVIAIAAAVVGTGAGVGLALRRRGSV